MTPIPAHSVTLAEFRAAPAATLGRAIDSGEVVLIGYDPDREATGGTAKPLAVLVGWDLWKRLAGSDEPGDDATQATEGVANEPTVAPEPVPAKAVPIPGMPGLWCCADPDCPGIVEEEGGFCGEHGEREE